jgi:hypothetical protein
MARACAAAACGNSMGPGSAGGWAFPDGLGARMVWAITGDTGLACGREPHSPAPRPTVQQGTAAPSCQATRDLTAHILHPVLPSLLQSIASSQARLPHWRKAHWRSGADQPQAHTSLQLTQWASTETLAHACSSLPGASHARLHMHNRLRPEQLPQWHWPAACTVQMATAWPPWVSGEKVCLLLFHSGRHRLRPATLRAHQ